MHPRGWNMNLYIRISHKTFDKKAQYKNVCIANGEYFNVPYKL